MKLFIAFGIIGKSHLASPVSSFLEYLTVVRPFSILNPSSVKSSLHCIVESTFGASYPTDHVSLNYTLSLIISNTAISEPTILFPIPNPKYPELLDVNAIKIVSLS